MRNTDEKTIDMQNFSFYEYQFPLSEWIQGSYSLKEMISIVTKNLTILQQLYAWENKGFVFSKPTRSLRNTFVFWIDESLIESVREFRNIRGGLPVSDMKDSLADSSTYKGKKVSPRPRRILLDIGCDSPSLVKHLEQLGLEVISLWEYVADLIHHEIIDQCHAQYIDLLVSTNERVLMPTEEWITYLMPHRTRLFTVPRDIVSNYENLAIVIKQKAFQKRRYSKWSEKNSQQRVLKRRG